MLRIRRQSREPIHPDAMPVGATTGLGVVLAVAMVLTLLLIPVQPAGAGPLVDITTRKPPPPPDQDDVEEAKKADDEKAAADAPTTKLDSVIVKGHRSHEDSEAEKVRKALEQKNKKPAPDPDLNKASDNTKEKAAWSQDPDGYKNLPGDTTHQFNAPVGDETAGCGADITKGCKPRQ